MDKDTARKIVQDTLQSSFNKELYVYFVRNLLNTIDQSKAQKWHGQYIKESFRDYIESYERIGTYTDPSNKSLDILIVYLKKETTLERARTAQRNFVATYLKTRGEKEASLVAFVSPNARDWRFSFVKMEYRLVETQKGTINATEEFSPARRYSFLVGEYESSHTAQTQFIPILENDKTGSSIEELEEAFSIERVTKEFFEKYRDLFLQLEEALEDVVKVDSKVKGDFKTKEVSTVDFAKKLLGQIVFLYFLQKKGWFGVERGEEWGAGSKHFLRELFEKRHGDYKNFFNNILEPLFYEALRLERPKDYYDQFKCRIPFLNGGLFDPINDYDWQDIDILLPDELFSNNIKDSKTGDMGTGIFDVFDRYNFTVKEDEPLEKEVAVDPEMLGKVFENLLEVKDRKSKGTYYTPREIVHYMCQESLANYIVTELNDQVGKEDIETLIKYGEFVVEHDSRVASVGRETDRYSFKLPLNVRKQSKLIDEKLASIRVCDPAVGSGAFPVGMMNEIIRIRNALTPHISDDGERSPYDFKRQAIENSLYGVNRDPGAVEIAKLRLWLSLIVDEEEREKIQPLPNLDYKIICGNSLSRVEKNLLNLALFDQLEAVKPLYFNEVRVGKKEKYKIQIDDLISKITNGHRDFDFEVYFSEVFHEKGGFDVVIANPPYGIKFNDSDLSELKLTYQYYDRQKNSASFFLELGSKVVNNNGVVTYIVPKSLSFSEGWRKTRILVSEINKLLAVVDVSKAFESVLLEQIVIAFKKDHCDTYQFQVGEGWASSVSIFGNATNELIESLDILPVYIDDSKQRVFGKMRENSVLLGDITKTCRGLPLQKSLSAVGSPILRGRNIGKFHVYDKIDNVQLSHEDQQKEKIQRLLNPKVISQNIVAHVTKPHDQIIIMAAVDRQPYLTLDTVMNTFLISDDFQLEYICAILNSHLASWFYYWFVYNRAIRTMHFDRYYLGKLPIKIADVKTQKSLGDLVKKIEEIFLSGTPERKKEPGAYQKELDDKIYAMYNLTKKEISIIEGKIA